MAKSEDDGSIVALHKTKDALTQIRSALAPFLVLLKEDNNRSLSDTTEFDRSKSKKRSKPDTNESPGLDVHRRAEAQAAVACKYYQIPLVPNPCRKPSIEKAMLILVFTSFASGHWDSSLYGCTSEGVRSGSQER